MLAAQKHTEVKVPCLDEGPNKLRRIHELYVSNDVVKNNAEFMCFTTALLLNFLFLEFFDFVQCFYRFVHVRKHTVRTDVQSFLYVVRLALYKNMRSRDNKAERTVGEIKNVLSK